MTNIQHPAVAGLFYPTDPTELRKQVLAFLGAGQANRGPAPKALIAPHAGYTYSGPAAGHAYAQLQTVADQIHHVVILAPAHRMAFNGLSYSSATLFRTPLGDLEVDLAALEKINSLPQVHLLDDAFKGEHSLEVHLPFLQIALAEIKITPLLVGNAQAEEVAEVLELLWGGEETLIIISSDLSHFLEYSKAQAIDAKTTQAIEELKPDAISHHQACGRIPICGLLLAAKKHHLTTTTLALCNSGDTAGSRDRVVGYGAYAFI
ncbi:COG1355, Predicted dioxygenase [hydrothermal vent metagenome]|uniref:COG1355, Predicted dioxygenase n=1 Tax=hydrothermal vent metagenome TaxID=652676 RepID=A0A3B1B2G2_9ZZZZ